MWLQLGPIKQNSPKGMQKNSICGVVKSEKHMWLFI